MSYVIIEEYAGGKKLLEVQRRLDKRLLVTTVVFPTEEQFKEKVASSVNLTTLSWRIIFQNNSKTLAKIFTNNFVYEYYCLHLSDGTMIFYNEGLVTLKYKGV